MGKVGSGVGLIRANPRIIAVLASATQSGIALTEAKGMRYYTFQLDNAGSPNGACQVEATIDQQTVLGLATNWYKIGDFGPQLNPPVMHIEYSSTGSILAVRVNVTVYNSGTFTVIGSAAH